MKNKKPWLNADGTEKSTEELRELGKSWDLKTWEAYAKTLEVKRSESLFEEPTDIEKQSEEDVLGIYRSDQRGSFIDDCPNVKRALQYALSCLSKDQRAVLDLIYFENNTIEETSKILGRNLKFVKRSKQRALEKMREIFKEMERPSTKARESSSLDRPTQTDSYKSTSQVDSAS